MIDSIAEIAIGSDHAGYKTKEFIKQHLTKSGYLFRDYGTFTEESMDYPDSAHPLSKAVQSGLFPFGILICGSGNGMAIVANKYPGIRAALCWNETITLLARQHNDANVLALPARYISEEEALRLSLLFLTTDFEGGRHEKRVKKISKIL
jgi:ribose 5-phosphate isomerase B